MTHARYFVRVNERIKVPQVRVINEQGEMVGIMLTSEALAAARAEGKDLIEISPKADPPVVKILSYDKYRYQLEKAESAKRKNQKRVEVKGIRLSVRIGQHDLDFKANQALKFLGQGNKVKIELFLRGRERANVGYAFEVLEKFLQTLPADKRLVEQPPKKLGNLIPAIITPKT